MNPEHILVQKLIQAQKTIALAESCTGGLLSHLLTNVPGSSKTLLLGLCVYSNTAKTRLLRIPPALIKQHGAVSEPVALLMADNARKLLKSDFGIGITGIAGPDGGTKSKPVGLVFIAVTTAKEKVCLECRFKGNRASIKQQTVDQAISLLLEFVP